MADWKSNPMVAVAAGVVLILAIIITVLALQPKSSSHLKEPIPSPVNTPNTQ